MAKLTVNEAALQGYTDVVTFEAGKEFEDDTTSGTAVLRTYAVPAGTVVADCVAHLTEEFTGPNLSMVTLDIGYGAVDSNLIDDFIADFELEGGDEIMRNTGAKLDAGNGAKGNGHLFESASNIGIRFTPTDSSMSDADTGRVVIKFKLLNVLDPSEITS